MRHGIIHFIQTEKFQFIYFSSLSEFYRQLKSSGISKAKALQNAQKKLIAKQRYRHPAYWAPFLLIGNWL
ncbi:MAG: CHAT domain-containing protein [Desulfobacteraceae bacterium]|nr:CHAT domain-containing protein [Desulfobacteraceae bacterium]